MSGKQAKKMQKDAGRSTGLSGVDLNKAHVTTQHLTGYSQYAWIKTGRMGSIIFRQFKKLQAASPLRSNVKKA